jgi:hypothetical protein
VETGAWTRGQTRVSHAGQALDTKPIGGLMFLAPPSAPDPLGASGAV